MRVPVLQNINWDPSAPAWMQTNSVHTDRHIYKATCAGKVTHTDVFRHSYTHEDTRTQWSQSRDRCDCSDHRNRTTSGLTVKVCGCFPHVRPSIPQTYCRCFTSVLCMCVAATLCQFSSTFSARKVLQYAHAPHRKVWPTKNATPSRFFGGEMRIKHGGVTQPFISLTTPTMTERAKMKVRPRLRQLSSLYVMRMGNADAWQEWVQLL